MSGWAPPPDTDSPADDPPTDTPDGEENAMTEETTATTEETADAEQHPLFLVAQDPDTARWQVARTGGHNTRKRQHEVLAHQSTTIVSTHRARPLAVLAARRAARACPDGAHLLTPETPGTQEVLFDKRLRPRWGWMLAVLAVIPLAWASSPEAWRDGIVPAAFAAVLMTVAGVGVIQTALTARRHPATDAAPLLNYIIIRLVTLGVAAAATAAAALAAGSYQSGTAGFVSRLPAVAMGAFSLLLVVSLAAGLITYATTDPTPDDNTDPEPDLGGSDADAADVDAGDSAAVDAGSDGSDPDPELIEGDEQP